ncbi:MAG: hypothetical protein LBG31_03570 [Prevotellaceae bacterium]|jgi:hypothetical protein|nr:hypothetical protein [Prevotellaceae bacterium]
MKKTFLSVIFLTGCYIIMTGQNINQNTVVIQQNTTPVVIEKPVYIERYRTVYKDRPQPKRIAKKLPAPIHLLGYLWVYPEDLGNFKQHPVAVISAINKQGLHGHRNWRIPTPDELALLEANAGKVGLGDDIYMATDHSNGVLRLVAREDTSEERAEKLGGVLINGVIWAKKNVGAADENGGGSKMPFDRAYTACPTGWRLPTLAEFRSLLGTGYYHKPPNLIVSGNVKLALPANFEYSCGIGCGGWTGYRYWTQTYDRPNNYYYVQTADDENLNVRYAVADAHAELRVRCVLAE